jgi:hypothetical protein
VDYNGYTFENSCRVAVWTSIDYKNYGKGELGSPAFILGCIALSSFRTSIEMLEMLILCRCPCPRMSSRCRVKSYRRAIFLPSRYIMPSNQRDRLSQTSLSRPATVRYNCGRQPLIVYRFRCMGQPICIVHYSYTEGYSLYKEILFLYTETTTILQAENQKRHIQYPSIH